METYSVLGIASLDYVSTYILGYLNTLGLTNQFPVQISEFIHINEEVINHYLTLSVDNFEVVHSQIKHKTITMHMYT